MSIRQTEILRQAARRNHEAEHEGRERKPTPGGEGWPKPVVPMRDVVSAELPSSAKVNDTLARRYGWLTRVTYAAGTSTTRYGEPGKLVESVAVRCGRVSGITESGTEMVRVVMIWHRPWGVDGAAYKFVAALVWGSTTRLRRVNLGEARSVLQSIVVESEATDEGTREE